MLTTVMPDSGASKLITEGRIKIKNGTGISRITETGISFEDGTETTADVIIFATGYSLYLFMWLVSYLSSFLRLGNSRDTVREICGDTLASRCTPIWGLDEEGELNGCWKEFGVPRLWYISGKQYSHFSYIRTIAESRLNLEGGLGHGRFHSKHVALRKLISSYLID